MTDLAVFKQSIQDGRLKLDCGTEISVVMGEYECGKAESGTGNLTVSKGFISNKVSVLRDTG